MTENMRKPMPRPCLSAKTIFPRPCLRTCKANAQTCPKPIPRPCPSAKTILPRPCHEDMQSQCPDRVRVLKLFSPDLVMRTCKANAQTCPKPIPRPCPSAKTILPRPCHEDMQSQCPDRVRALKLFSADHV